MIFIIDEFNSVSFHDQKLIDIRKENYDVIIVAKNEDGAEFEIVVKNAKIETNADFDILDMKGSYIIGMSYHESDDDIKYIHLETVSRHIPFTDEVYFYSKEIIILKK